MRSKWDRKNKTDIFNDRMKQRKEKEAERKRLFEEAGKPDPNYKKPDDSAQQPPAPSTSTPPSSATPATPAKPEPPVTAPAPKPVKNDTASRPGKADRLRRGSSGRHGSKF
ncbi:MAG: hypothetical protein EPN97_11630 [Alphaproteobacteria bacterium]|nr:MAG: hypothetical protein EPN97_11630 [Alphaproteobacteria bacterium]